MAQAVRYRLSSQLKFNIKSYLDREFVNSGLFVNIASGVTYRPGQRIDLLTRVDGNLYESYFNNWIFEPDASGVAGFPTIQASGVFIDGVFHAKGVAPYEPEIDYNDGRIFFNGTAIPVASTVSAEFSYKNVGVNFVKSQAINLIFSQFKDSVDFTQNSVPSGLQRQLPAVVIDIQKRLGQPHALGGAVKFDTLVAFHVLGNNETEIDQIIDILTETSFRKAFRAIDYNKIPLLFTDRGDKASTYKSFSQLQKDTSVFLSQLYIDEARLMEQWERFGVHYARVHWNTIIFERGAG